MYLLTIYQTLKIKLRTLQIVQEDEQFGEIRY